MNTGAPESKSANTARKITLAVLVVAFLGVVAWRGMPYWERRGDYWMGHQNSNSSPANTIPTPGPPIMRGLAEPVFENLRVGVRGSPEALTTCRVWASFADGAFAEAARVGVGRYVFTQRLVPGCAIVAIAPFAAQKDDSGRAIPHAHISETIELDAASPSNLDLELKPSACLTADVRSSENQVINDAAVSVDFVGERAPFHWLNVLRLSGIEALESWLQGTPRAAPQVPLLRAGTRLRLIAESKGRFGATQPLEIAESISVKIVLGVAVSFADIEARDLTGKPVSDLALAFTVFGRKVDAPLRTGATLTDAHGNAHISGGEGEASIEVWVVSDSYCLAGGSAKIPLDHAAHTLTLSEAFSIKLDVRFEDDQQYTGPLLIRSEPQGMFSRAYSAPGVALSYSGPRGSKPEPDPSGLYEVRGVSRDLDLVCTATPNRTGYGWLNATLAKADLVPNGNYTLRIARATAKQPSAKIAFSGDFEKLADAHVRIIPVNSPYGIGGPYALKFQRETSLMLPGDYRIELTGKNSSWLSEVITLSAGETKHVALPLAAPASVTATILDQDGKPLSGAALCRSAASVGFPARATPWLAVSDAVGIAKLEGCPAGSVELRLEADGCEPQTVVVTLISGVMTDIGSFRLQPARGEIRVKIKNFDRIAKLSPQIEITGMYGGTRMLDRGPFALVSGDYAFVGLPLGRTYHVVLAPPNGGSWHIINLLRPTEAQPIVEVEVDAATFTFDE